MKNLVLVILLALLVTVTVSSLWRMFAATATINGVRPLVAIGTDPVPPFPPAPTKPTK